MYTNQNSQPQRRRVKRYTPGHTGRATKQAVIILVSVFLIGCIVGACVGIGIYRSVNKNQGKETFGTVGVIDPSLLNDTSSVNGNGNSANGKKLICIDPGHGFADVGAVSDLVLGTEYSINMKFSEKLRDALVSLGFEVVFTHDGKTIPENYDLDNDGLFEAVTTVNGVSRSERREYAQSLSPDYFISIHCNTYIQDASIGGMRIYYEGNNNASADASEKIAAAMSDVERTYPVAAPAKATPKFGDEVYAVTNRWENTPAILAELGYMTNATDASYLQNEAWLDAVSAVYARAIANYFS